MESKALSQEVLVRLDLQPQSLGCVVAAIDLSEKRSCSLFHWQIFKSRSLIFSFPDLLVSPAPAHFQEFQEILVVAHRDIILNGKLDSYLQETRLTKKRCTLEPSSDVLQAVLRYSLVARLAPQWNAVACKAVYGSSSGDLLFRGRNFLTEAASTPSDAVALRVFVAGGTAWLGLRVCRARLPVLRLEDLHVSSGDIAKLLSHPDGFIDETKISSPWVNVIPSLCRARITLLTRGFPMDCSFDSYASLRRHWKIMYGYRLPQLSSTSTPVFASVSFLYGDRPFLYPLSCLLRTPPTALRHDRPQPVIEDFIRDVDRCTPANSVVEIAGRPVAEFMLSSQVNSCQAPVSAKTGTLEELLIRPCVAPESVSSDENSPERPRSERPTTISQPVVHFMSRLSKLARQPLAQRSSNVQPSAVPSSARAHAASSSKQLSLPQPTKTQNPSTVSKPKGIFRPLNVSTKKASGRVSAGQKCEEDRGNLLHAGNLRKATCAQLQQWLKQNGFEMRGRPKKDDLVARVKLELDKNETQASRDTGKDKRL